ncbi:MAG: hypothetical protein ACOQNV_02725 [Mycoplasmoidaceae bacterium]
MKLLKKIVPFVATITTAAAGVVPMVTSCTTKEDDEGWINGKIQYDPAKFSRYTDGQIAVYDPVFNWVETYQKATDKYIEAIKANPNIIYDDFKSSLNQLDQMVLMIPQYLQCKITDSGIYRKLYELIEQLIDILPSDYWLITILAGALIMSLFYFTPFEDVQVRKLRGKLSDFTIDEERATPEEWAAPLVSYNKSMDIDCGLKLGLDSLPQFVLDIIHQLFGITPSVYLNVRLEADADLNKIPVVVWADAILRSKKQLFSIISGEEYDNANYYGLCFVPDTQDKQYLTDEDSGWSAKIDLKLTIEIKGGEFAFRVFGGSKETFIFDYEIWSKLFGPMIQEVPKAVVFAIESVLGWSTYYYYDQIYPNPIG